MDKSLIQRWLQDVPTSQKTASNYKWYTIYLINGRLLKPDHIKFLKDQIHSTKITILGDR